MKSILNDKRGLLPRDILICIVLFGMFIGGAFLIVGGMFGSYGIPYSDNSSVYNKVAEIYSSTDSMKNSISNSGVSTIGDVLLFPKGVWESIKLVINSGSIITGMVEAIGNDYNIPPIFIFGFITIVTITIIFGIISSIMRKKT